MWFSRDVYLHITYLNNFSYCDKYVHMPKIVLEKMKSCLLGLKSTIDNKKLERNKLEMRSGGSYAIVYW